jgi:hypothetical protein
MKPITGALDHDLHEDIAPFSANCAPDADLADTLGDARKHDVRDADAADEQADASDQTTGVARIADILLNPIEPLLPGVEAKILHVAMRMAQDAADLLDGRMKLGCVGDLEGEAVELQLSVPWSISPTTLALLN